VVQAERDGTYGNWVLIEHGDGIQTGYAHIVNGGTEVAVGQNVEAGQEIARVGATGAATGCHLHFEVRISGKAVDPVPFMAKRGIPLG
jgi:murein DD-endopeptidase MepM/ murein hydrolase activator NlpD